MLGELEPLKLPQAEFAEGAVLVNRHYVKKTARLTGDKDPVRDGHDGQGVAFVRQDNAQREVGGGECINFVVFRYITRILPSALSAS